MHQNELSESTSPMIRPEGAAMAELRFLGLSEDGTQLRLADSRGRNHTLTVDTRLLAAMRLDGPLTGQREITLNDMLTPREIQARLRAGASISGLADELGIDENRIERFSGPPLADRAFAADQAKAATVSSHLGERTLETTVLSAAEESGIAPEAVRWDAWLREDGRWQVLTATPAGAVDQVATWTFDPHDARIEADDAVATSILAGPRVEGHLHPVDTPGSASTRRRKPTASKQASTRQAAVTEGASAPGVHAPTEVPTESVSITEEQEIASEGPPVSAPPRTRKGKRASVPTWDEILFGSQADGDSPEG